MHLPYPTTAAITINRHSRSVTPTYQCNTAPVRVPYLGRSPKLHTYSYFIGGILYNAVAWCRFYKIYLHQQGMSFLTCHIHPGLDPALGPGRSFPVHFSNVRQTSIFTVSQAFIKRCIPGARRNSSIVRGTVVTK